MTINTETITLKKDSTRLSIRNGISLNPAVLSETLEHYGEAVKALQAGVFELSEEWGSRNEYESPNHNEAVVTIYRLEAINVPCDGRIVPIELNVFTERTSAQDMLNHVSNVLLGLGAYFQAFGYEDKPSPPTQQNNTDWQQFNDDVDVIQNEGKQSQPDLIPPSASGDTPLLAFPASKEDKVTLGEKYHQQVVAFAVSGVEMKFSQKTGKPEYQFYAFYNGSPSKYPAYGLSIDTQSNYANSTVVEQLTQLNIKPQERRPINARVVVYVKSATTKDGGPTTYYNINKLDIAQETK